jgi:hypothetical protein
MMAPPTTQQEPRASWGARDPHDSNCGYGGGARHGLPPPCRYHFVVQLDADGQHDPAQIDRLLGPLTRGRRMSSSVPRPAAAAIERLARLVGILLFAWLDAG